MKSQSAQSAATQNAFAKNYKQAQNEESYPPSVEVGQDDLVRVLKAAGDSLRIDILRVLDKDSYGVLELAEAFDVTQSGMSHHLKVLTKAGLISSRREGNSLFYRRNTLNINDPLQRLKHSLFDAVNTCNIEDTKIIQRFKNIHAAREKASQQFFRENTDKFAEQQDLIASYAVYGQHVEEILNNILFDQVNPFKPHSALEVGPGQGEFLTVLAKHFEQVTALDTSSTLLEKARARTEKAGVDNVRFIHGDTGKLLNEQDTFNCCVMNMVLHHTSSPQQILVDIHNSLQSNGILIVTELCQHSQEWAREACGDLWLGIAPEDLIAWAGDAGFDHQQHMFLALRNGFQVQIQTFTKDIN